MMNVELSALHVNTLQRAYYDRTGYESSAAAAAASAAQQQQQQRYNRGPGGVYYQEEFDPEEIFNMFFG